MMCVMCESCVSGDGVCCVQGYKQRGAYLATQAPLPNTVNDFWRMMWEFKSRAIVMLCQLTEENGQVYM